MSAAVLTFTLKAKDEASRVVSAVTGRVGDDVKALDSTVGKLAQSFGFSDSKAAALAKTLPAIGAAAGAVAGVVTAAGAAIFTLTRNASDAGSAIFEAGQKTNASAEFLSVLKVQAEQSGSSFEGATAKVVKWGNSLVDAARGNKELTADLKRFGIDAAQAYRNPEAALKTFIETFNRLPPSAANNEAAMRLFKDRSGELIPVLRAFGGDYDELVRKLDASGQIWTQEGAEKADEFGDALTELGQIASGIGNVFARELMPEITSAMKDISTSVTANRDAFRAWGRDVGDLIRGVRELADSHLGRVVGLLAQVAYYTTPAAMLVGQTAAIGGAAKDAEAARNFGPFGGRGVATPLTRGTPGAAPLAPADVRNEAAARDAASKAEAARKAALRAAEKSAEERLAVERRFLESVGKLVEGNRRELEDAQKESARLNKEDADRRADLSDRVRAAIREEVAAITDENQHIRATNDLIKEAEVFGAITAREKAWLSTLAVIREIGKEIERVNAATLPELSPQGLPIPQGEGPVVSPEDLAAMGEPPDFSLWTQALGGLKGAAKDAFGGITQGFGQMIHSFLMGEKLSGKAFMSMAKSAIASVAAQAGVRALFEVGMALASMWLNPAEAATHWLAAKTFGIVAAFAGGAALAIPGGGASTGSAFSGGGSAFGGGGFGSTAQDTGPRVVEQSRNTSDRQVIVLRVESNDSHILSVVQDDVKKNGATRNLIIETAAA